MNYLILLCRDAPYEIKIKKPRNQDYPTNGDSRVRSIPAYVWSRPPIPTVCP